MACTSSKVFSTTYSEPLMVKGPVLLKSTRPLNEPSELRPTCTAPPNTTEPASIVSDAVPLAVNTALILISRPALKLSSLALQLKPLLTLMSLLAASATSVVPSKAFTADAVIKLSAPGNLVVASRSVAAEMSSPVVASPLISAVAPIVILSGSSNRVPRFPKGARVSTVPLKSK